MEHDEPFSQEGSPAKEEQSSNQEEAQLTTTMESLLEQEDLALDLARQGEIREGVIVSVSDEEILVSVGTKSEGVIPKKELDQLDAEQREQFQVGDAIPVYIVTPEDQHGNLLLSYTRALEEKDWKRAEELLESGEVYQGQIQGYNKGGLIVPLGFLRGFVPGSQVSLSRRMAYSGNTPDQRWGKMVGEPIAARVIEVDRERRRLILSERAALQESRELLKERLLAELEEGEVRTGRVTSLADFGAFVNINGADGLVHLTEISWERIEHPSEVLKVGQEVQVKVVDIDHERKRIGLSIRQLQPDPWPDKVADLQAGQLVEATIVRLVKFGAFARIHGLDIEGLIHISEISDERIEHPKEVLQENEDVTLRVINIDTKRHRIGLSLRKVDSPAYADLDWKMAMAEAERSGALEAAPEEASEAEEAAEPAEAEMPAETEASLEASPEEWSADAEASMEAEAPAEAEASPEATEMEPAVEIEAGTEAEAEAPAETEASPEATEMEPTAEIEASMEEEVEAPAEPEEALEADEPPESSVEQPDQPDQEMENDAPDEGPGEEN